MDEVLFVVQTPIFWFTTVFVGLLLSVFGAAIYDWLKIQVGKFSSKQRKRNEAEKERIEQEARKCAKSVKLIVLRVAAYRRLSSYASTVYGAGVSLFFVGALFVFIWSPHIFPIDCSLLLSALQKVGQAEMVFRPGYPVLFRGVVAFFQEGWQPLRVYKLYQLVGLFTLFSGVYLVVVSNAAQGRARFLRRVLHRAGQLIEEDLENETPNADSEHSHNRIQTDETC